MADDKPIEGLKEEVNLNLKVDECLDGDVGSVGAEENGEASDGKEPSHRSAEVLWSMETDQPDKGSTVLSQDIRQSLPPESVNQEESVKIRVDPLVGKLFEGKYEIQSCAGRGGMSAVYKALHLSLNKTVAIKLLYTHLSFNAKNILRFQQEAQVVSHLNHPGIVRLFDFGQDADGQPYLVMEFLKGQPLSDILDAKKTELDIDLCLKYLIQMCEALNHAHKNGVIHRDLKPSNVFVEPDDEKGVQVKITDFGIAKLSAKEDGEEKRGDLKLTATGEVFGSPLYMSPEQCMGQKVDHRTDIYSLGCLMYEVLTGLPPHEGDTVYETMQKHLYEQAELPGKLRPEIRKYSDLEVIVLKTIAKKPQDRYQTVEELLTALKGVAKSSPYNPVNYITRTFGIARYRSKQKFVFAMFCTCAAIFSVILVLGASYIWSFQKPYMESKVPAVARAQEGSWRRLSEDAQESINGGAYDAAKTKLAEAEKAARSANKTADVLQTIKKEAIVAKIIGDKTTVDKLIPEIATLKAQVEAENQGSEELALLLESFDGYPDNMPSDRQAKFNSLAVKLIDWSRRLIRENRFAEAENTLAHVSGKLSKSKHPDPNSLLKTQIAELELPILRHREPRISHRTKDDWKAFYDACHKLHEMRDKPPTGMSPADKAWIDTLTAYGASIRNNSNRFKKASRDALAYYHGQNKVDEKERTFALLLLADGYDQLQLVKDANRLYEEALPMFEVSGDGTNAGYIYARIADNLVDQRKPDEAFKMLNDALEKKVNKSTQVDDLLVADLYQSLGKVLYVRQQYGSAADAYLNEARIKQHMLSPEAWEQGKLLLRVAESLNKKADIDANALKQSEPFVKQWIAILELEARDAKEPRARQKFETDIADVQDRLSYIYMHTNRGEEAKRLFKERLAALYAKPRQDIIYLNEWLPDIAEKYLEPEEKTKLISRIKESELAAKAQLKEMPLAEILDGYGRLYWHLGDKQKSIETLKEAASVAEANFSKYAYRAARVFEDYAIVLNWNGQNDEAAKVRALRDKLMGGG